MENIIIRECTYEDLEQVVSLQQQWAKEEITHGFLAAVKPYLETKLGKYFYVGERNKEIIGFVYGAIHQAENMAVFHNGEHYIEIEDVYIDTSSRATGLGTLLVEKILEVAKEEGVERSLVYSSTKDMERILKFYKKQDYKTWCIQMFK